MHGHSDPRLDHPAADPPARIDSARQHAELRGLPLRDALIELDLATDEAIAGCLAEGAGLPLMDHRLVDQIDDTLCARISAGLLHERLVLPIDRCSDGTVRIAMADPTDLTILDDLRVLLEAPVTALVAPKGLLRDAIAQVTGRISDTAQDIARRMEPEATEGQGVIDLLAEVTSPVVQFVHRVLGSALEVGASDVHFEPQERHLTVRYRVDGLLRPGPEAPISVAPAVGSRIKIMAGLDVAEHRLPQDGRIRVRVGERVLELRVSVTPTAFGERVVMRLATPSTSVLSFERLGMQPAMVHRWERIVARPHGIVLVTGPTGSGKTMTLYSTLSHLRTPVFNILTAEDPVEVHLPGIAQVPVREAIGLTFPVVLRSFLRQDPDILLVGEIRDRPTADIAVQAALTGHRVLSTLHTNDAPTAFTRLVDLGIDAYKVADSILGVLAQRLVRRLCPKCCVDVRLDPADAAALQIAPEAKGPGGCAACDGIGYRDRIGIFELLEATDALRDHISAGASAGALRRVALQDGFEGMRLDGGAKVAAGLTSADEVLRIV